MKKINLIPMAGAGKRFQDEGYNLPKPLIPVDNKPMILQACDSLPESEEWIFVCRDEHLTDSNLKETLTTTFQNCKIISIDYLTEGQATTCTLANSYISDESSLLVGPCDNGMIWNKEKYNDLINDPKVDALIWTFRNNSTVKRNPKMYGWVEVNDDMALKVSCKVPISENPILDHAIVGTFWFRKAKYFKEAYERMYSKNRRVNNEFYMDELMNELIEHKLNVKIFEIDKYICWGTPNDLRTYNYWKDFFKI
jgi:dTDP-glucose pyrophosphorylase